MNTENITKLLTLSDSELKERISAAAGMAGANKLQLQFALSDMEKVRNVLSSLTDGDIDKLVSKIGAQKAEEIARKLNNGEH